MNDLEHLTVQLFARFGLKELGSLLGAAGPHDVFSDAYSSAMEFLPGSVGFVDDIRDNSVYVHALHVALLLSSPATRNSTTKSCGRRRRGLLMSYFVPECVGIVVLEWGERSGDTAKE